MWIDDDVAPTRRQDFWVLLVTGAALVLSVVFWLQDQPSEARPMIHACDPGDCTTQTLRPGGFNPVAHLSGGGHQATVSGHLTEDCSAKMHYVITVKVVQDDVTATGHSQSTCSEGPWVLRVHTTGNAALVAGVADEACAELSLYARSEFAGSHRWCKKTPLELR